MGLPDAISFLRPVAEAKVVLVFLELYPAPVSYTHLDVYKRQ